MQEKMNALFASVDLILGPTSPELAWKLGESLNDPLRNYLADVYTIPANMG
jgi:aspartyl-tRNA(Asn)/glutamyl-tRNA(Gln) amidotransferase subunit A